MWGSWAPRKGLPVVLFPGRVPGQLRCLPLHTLGRIQPTPRRLGRSSAERDFLMSPWKSPEHYTASPDHRPQPSQCEQQTLTLSLEARVQGRGVVRPVPTDAVRETVPRGSLLASHWSSSCPHGFSVSACVQIPALCRTAAMLDPSALTVTRSPL